MHDYLHTNAFLEMHGIPYLLGEYCDRDHIEQIDRSMIYTDVHIDTSDERRAVIDISIDDIGRRASDGMPNLIDNHRKQMDIVKGVRHIYHRCAKSLPVIRSGVIARVNYRMENGRTGEILRSVYEDIKIPERSYFVSVTPKDVNRNAIVTNFASTQVSSINQFTHGRDPITLRITSVQLCYEVLNDYRLVPRGRIDKPLQRMEDLGPHSYYETYGVYEYIKAMQNRQYVGEPMYDMPGDRVYPPDWFAYNQLYHFEHHGSDIILHMDDIYNHMAKTTLIECGRLTINRTFTVNPGERLVFKLSIWKNDLALFDDTRPIAEALESHWNPYPHVDHDVPYEGPFDDPVYPYPKDGMDEVQNIEIMRLNEKIDALIKQLIDMGITPYPPVPGPRPPHPPAPGPGPCPPPPVPDPGKKKIIEKILKTIKEMQEEIKKIEEQQCDCPEIEPITDEEIEDILDSIDDDPIGTTTETSGIDLSSIDDSVI